MKSLCALTLGLLCFNIGAAAVACPPVVPDDGTRILLPDLRDPIFRGPPWTQHPITVKPTGQLQHRPPQFRRIPLFAWFVSNGLQEYALDFHGDEKLQQQAAALKGKAVIIVGKLRTMDYHFRRPIPQIDENSEQTFPMLPIPIPVLSGVIQVESIVAAEGAAKPNVIMELEGTLDFTISKTWLKVEGKRYELEIRPGVQWHPGNWNGKRLLVRGRLERRGRPSMVPTPLGGPAVVMTNRWVFVVCEVVMR